MIRHIPFVPTLIATGFGCGFWPWGPGTMGALFATLLWMGASFWLDAVSLAWGTLAAAVVFTGLGTWATHKLQPFWGDDPSRVVVDEMVGVWIPLIVCPAGHWLFAALAFVLFRFFDIVKPLGIRALDRRRGAFWVMADDILAGIYSLLVLLLVIWMI